jgi:hypothetical protein
MPSGPRKWRENSAKAAVAGQAPKITSPLKRDILLDLLDCIRVGQRLACFWLLKTAIRQFPQRASVVESG